MHRLAALFIQLIQGFQLQAIGDANDATQIQESIREYVYASMYMV